jgi:cell division protein FtsZ
VAPAVVETADEAAPAPVAEAASFVDPSLTTEDELLLDTGTIVEPEAAPVAEAPKAGSRWLSTPAAEPEAKAPTPGGGTLFERMSNIARGSAKVDNSADSSKDPLDIPRFLNRQNNQ